MKRRTVPITVSAEDHAEVERRLRQRDLVPRVRERLEMVKGVALGYNLDQIATWTGRSVRRIPYWLRRFAEHGLDALADDPRAGRPPKADAPYCAALETAVLTPPPALGLPFDVWTSDRLGAYLAEQTGVRVAPGWIRALLAHRDFVCGRPKHTLKHRQDPQEVAACRAALAEAGEKGAGGAGALRTAPSR